MVMQFILIIAGFVVLILGADFLVKGSASIARRLGIKTFVIGLTVVAFGTSAPELAINIASVLDGSSGLALGNIFGSNIANTLLILGVTAMITTITMSKGTVWKEIPLSVLASLLIIVLGADMILDGASLNVLTRIDGIVLLSVFSIFLCYTFGISKAETGEKENIELLGIWRSISYILVGIFGLVFGGDLIKENAVLIAEAAGVAEHVIGATIVALGTSLPELVTAIVAALKGHAELAVGNVVGSNIFNILFVLGITSIVGPLPYSFASFADAWIVLGVSLLLFVAMFFGKRHALDKREGMLFLGLYLAFILFKVFYPIQ